MCAGGCNSKGTLLKIDEETLNASLDHLDQSIPACASAPVTTARRAASAGLGEEIGALLDRNWRRKRELASSISEERIDRWYEAALAAGAPRASDGSAALSTALLDATCAKVRALSARHTELAPMMIR